MTTTPRRRTICASPHEALGLHEGKITLIVRPVKLPCLVGPSSGKGVREIVPSLLPNRGDLFDVRYGDDNPSAIRCPFGRVGDLLEFKETWQDYCPLWNGYWCGHGTQEGIEKDHRPVYKADDPSLWPRGPQGEERPPLKWRSAATMPRWAVRTRRTIIDVRAKRARDLSSTDMRRAGMPDHEYVEFYESRHGAGSWAEGFAWLIGVGGKKR